jgi:hypothetical protein
VFFWLQDKAPVVYLPAAGRQEMEIEDERLRLPVHCWSGGLTHAALVLMVLTLPGSVASAQVGQTASSGSSPSTGPPRVELFAGYSYLPETDSYVRSFTDAGHGFGASAAFNLSKSFGFVADVDTHSWTVHGHPVQDVSFGDRRMRLTYASFGPRLAIRAKRVSTFGFVTFDWKGSHFSTMEYWWNGTRYTTDGNSARAWGPGFGAGVDIGLTKHIAVRALQVNCSLGGFGEGPGGGRQLRLKFGLVLML